LDAKTGDFILLIPLPGIVTKAFSTSPLILGLIEDIEISMLKPSQSNLRKNVGNLADLSNSIKEKGLLQPILVRNKQEYYEIIAGRRRYEACKVLGWRKIICHIVELDDKEAFEVSLIENIQRKTLNPIEEAEAYRKYIVDFGWGGITDLADRIGKSKSYLDKKLRLLELPSDIIDSISSSSIKISTAEELLPLRDEKQQLRLAALAERGILSSRGIRELVTHIKRNEVYDYGIKNETAYKPSLKAIDELAQRSFDKSIVTLKMAMSKLCAIIQEAEENWIVYEILMQHKNILHSQVDILIKEKMKL
jgi:ParB family transcriptional regulator, chromosome partitioning protein